jgi:hypothetical protein
MAARSRFLRVDCAPKFLRDFAEVSFAWLLQKATHIPWRVGERRGGLVQGF